MDIVTAHWLVSWPLLAGCAVLVAAHLSGLRRMLRDSPVRQAPAGAAGRTSGSAARSDLIRQAVIFQVGLLIAVLAMVSPVGYWSSVYIWVHALQDLLLAFIAPGLIVLGAPWQPLRRGWPGAVQGPPRQPGAAADRIPPVPWWLAGPVAVVIAFNALWLGWHLPAFFDATRASGPVACAEYATYLAIGILFWLQLIGSRPASPAAAPLRRFGLLTGTVIVSTVLGMVLVFGAALVYPAFVGPAHHLLSVVDDQQLAGAVLWMGMLPPMIVAAVAVLLRWLDDEESAELSAGLDRLVTPRKSAWPSRAGRG